MELTRILPQVCRKFMFAFSPMRCCLCDTLADHDNLCDLCRSDLSLLSGQCSLCSQELSASPLITAVCGPCILKPPPWSQLICAHRYCSPVDQLIHRLKFSADLSCARLLAAQITRQILQTAEQLPEVLVPVPLHWWRHYRRGFNQSLEISAAISCTLGIKTRTDFCRRVRNTNPQSQLPAAARKRNLQNAFQLVQPVNKLRLAVIDDVFTTGATARELCGMFQKAGAADVQLWVCASAFQSSNSQT